MPDNRRNIQIVQPNIVGNDTVDKNGWPTPLTDGGPPLKLVVTDGRRGETRDFRAMATSRQNDISKPEGDNSGKGTHAYDEELTLSVKKTVGDSTK